MEPKSLGIPLKTIFPFYALQLRILNKLGLKGNGHFKGEGNFFLQILFWHVANQLYSLTASIPFTAVLSLSLEVVFPLLLDTTPSQYYLKSLQVGKHRPGTLLLSKRFPSFQGRLTDFNVWGRELQESEMKDFTKCKEPHMSGDLIPWNITDWAFTEGIQLNEYKDMPKLIDHT